MDDRKKRAWAEISMGAIEHNYRAMREKLPAGCRFLGVVKANAYGHGAVPVARRLEELGCDYLAVACLDEARELRRAGIALPILILGYTPPDYAPELAELHVTQAVGSLAMARAMNDALAPAGKKLKIHLKMETGMGRTGFRAFEDSSLADAAGAAKLPLLEAEGIFTHFCVSDGAEDVRPFTLVQLRRFLQSCAALEAELKSPFQIRHATNSGAMMSFPEAWLDMVRPGVSLYGMYPGPDKGGIELRPAMTLKCRVACVEAHEPGDTISYGRTFRVEKPSKIAVLPLGYADGLHRALSGKLLVSVNGQIAPQVGRICMDMCMADVTGLDVKPGDEVTVFGGEMPIDRVAEQAGTIHYEITCAVSPRVTRIYVD